MKIKNVPYFKTSLKIDNNIKNSAETGWLTTGPMVKQFESEISDFPLLFKLILDQFFKTSLDSNV